MKVYVVFIKYMRGQGDEYIDKIFASRESAEKYVDGWSPFEYSIDEYDVEE